MWSYGKSVCLQFLQRNTHNLRARIVVSLILGFNINMFDITYLSLFSPGYVPADTVNNRNLLGDVAVISLNSLEAMRRMVVADTKGRRISPELRSPRVERVPSYVINTGGFSTPGQFADQRPSAKSTDTTPAPRPARWPTSDAVRRLSIAAPRSSRGRKLCQKTAGSSCSSPSEETKRRGNKRSGSRLPR